ncbi:hypothetical protein [Glutamicibacter protophormiae]
MASTAQVDQAVQVAHEAFLVWSALPAGQHAPRVGGVGGGMGGGGGKELLGKGEKKSPGHNRGGFPPTACGVQGLTWLRPAA